MFLEEYLRLANICVQNGFQWFLPGFVHPLQAMMILLLHLTSCSALHFEEDLRSKQLLIEVFELVGNRLQQGRLVSLNADIANSQGRSDKASLIYCLLAKLRHRVWERAAWQSPPPHGGQDCPLENLTEAIEFAHSEEQSEQQFQHPDATDNVQQPPGLTDVTSMEPIDETEFDQYDALFEQFLQPGVMG